MADVNISVAAQIKELRRSFAEIPGIGEKEARGLARKFSREVRQLERSAKRAAAKQRDLGDAMEGAKNAAEGLGGSIGGAAGQIEKAIQASMRLGGAMGPIGVAAVATTAAATGLGLVLVSAGSAMVDMVRSADELVDSLGAVATALPEETVRTIEDAGDAIERLELTAQLASVTFAAELAPAVERTANLLVRIYGAADEAGATLSWMGEKADDIARATMPRLYVAMQSAAIGVRALDEATADYGQELTEFLEIQQEWAKHEKDLAAVVRESQQERSDAQRQAAEDAAYVNEMLRDEARFLEEARRANEKFEASLVATTEATAELGAEVQTVATDDLAALAQAIDDLGTTAEITLRDNILGSAMEIGSALTDTVQAYAQVQIDQLQRIADEQVKAADREDKAWARQQRQRVQDLLAQGALTDEQASKRLSAIDREEQARLKKNQRLKKDEERAAKKAFKAAQSAAVASVLIDVARTTAALSPFFWFLGPGAPVAALGVAGAMGGAQIAAIQSAPPPTFATGGRVGDRFGGDHVPIMATRNEGIVTEAGMSRIGGSAGLEAINRGRGMGGDVTVVLPDGAVARATRRHMMGSAGRQTVALQAGLPVGQAWVYGGR